MAGLARPNAYLFNIMIRHYRCNLEEEKYSGRDVVFRRRWEFPRTKPVLLRLALKPKKIKTEK